MGGYNFDYEKNIKPHMSVVRKFGMMLCFECNIRIVVCEGVDCVRVRRITKSAKNSLYK